MLKAHARAHWRFNCPHPVEALASFAARHAWLALPFLAIPAVLAYWTSGFPETADGHLHLLRLALVDRYVEQGWFYPRWIPDLVLGRGYPLLNFYAPAAYYVAEGLHLLGFGYQHALALAFASFIILAGAGMYLLAGEIFGPSQRRARLVAATAYMYAPYLLANTFVRGAVAEAAAEALLPWVFWTTHRLLTRGQPKRDIVPAALALAGLAVTHNITLLFLPAVWLAYVLVLWWRAGRRRDALLWAAAAGALGMGLSTFFWLPMAVERAYLSGAAYAISARVLPENVWTWRNFLDPNFFYRYGYEVPYRLGLVQLGLAIAGFFLARRRDAVWLFYAALALVVALAIGQWTLPIWLNVKVLLTAQFPWRLLSIVSVPLALFTGGIVVHLRPGWISSGVTLALLALIIVAQRPHPAWVSSMALDSTSIEPASAAHFEADSGALGTSNASEFLPRWVTSTHLSQPAQAGPGAEQVRLLAANAFELSLDVTGEGGPLRANTFYYPGWTATLDHEQDLRTYPSTELGLLTVDLPPGTHQVSLRWNDTSLARAADLISLITLLAATLWCLWLRPRHPLAVPLLLLCLVAGAAFFYRPGVNPVTAPVTNVGTGAVQLLGYQVEPGDGQHVLIRPFWYAKQTPPADMRVRWQLLDGSGQVLTQVEGAPYYGTTSAGDWPPGTVVRDAYRLPLPAAAARGNYHLAVQIESSGAGAAIAPVIAGPVVLPVSQPSQPDGAAAVDARFGESIALKGYGLAVNGRPVSLGGAPPPAVRPGDRIEYNLYWQGDGPIDKNYHGFVHLLDQSGEALAKRDQWAGSLYATTMLWDATRRQRDTYRLLVPQDSPGGLYSAAVGLYDAHTLERLPVGSESSPKDASDYRLPPIKVLRKDKDRPERAAPARFGDFARLTGYTLQGPAQVRPGDELRLTLYYQAEKNSGQDLTRFVQLHNPDLGMAAQNDGIPQNGNNPTWSWAPGEQIRDEIVLTVAPDARPGRYTLGVGLYDAQSGG
ncbi:MAG: 6-pyruvoyl-tetrahydropterin synthase-related protein, partial [Nitrososphaerales archaeon]